jgi:hypothetical protein
MPDSSSSEVSRPWALYLWMAVVLGLIVAALVLAGWHGPATQAPTNGGQIEAQGEICHEQLLGILRAVEPTALGLTSEYSDRAHDLNLWLADCGDVLVEGRIAEDQDLVRRLLTPSEVDATLSPHFTTRDVAHLRTAILLRQMAEHIVDGIEDREAQAVALFDYVQRTVLDAEGLLPHLTPYEVLLFGLGSPELKAWVYGELLRQVELDAVIVRPRSGDAPERWLVGVPVGPREHPRVLLFDAHIGLPIPAKSEATSQQPFVRRAASLADVRENDALLRALDAPDRPYPLTSAHLAQVRVELIGHSSVWSNRVATLNVAANIRGASFYSGLGRNRLRTPGLFDRVAAAGRETGWDVSDVGVWAFPAEQLEGFENPPDTAIDGSPHPGQVLLSNLRQMLAGPIIRKFIHPETGREITWNHPLIRARHLQITGALSDAIREYNQIRQGVNVFTPEPINGLCLESAVFWTAACQYELGENESVINMGLGGQYPPQFVVPTRPIWGRGMLQLTALSFVRQGRYSQARELLSQLPRTETSHGWEYVLRRWERLSERGAGGDPPQTAPPPASPDGEAN